MIETLRTLRREPAFALVALLTLGFGIGSNAAIFSIIKAVVLDPLPYENSERIAVLWEVNPEGSLERVSIPTFQDWKTESQTFEALAAYRQVDFTFAGASDPLSIAGVRATPELFAVLNARPAIGRLFTPEEATLGATPVVVVSHGFWQRALGADRGIVGRTIQLDAQAVELALAEAGEKERRLAQRLARERARVHGRAAGGRRALDARDALAEVRRLRRPLLARGTDADDHEVVVEGHRGRA